MIDPTETLNFFSHVLAVVGGGGGGRGKWNEKKNGQTVLATHG